MNVRYVKRPAACLAVVLAAVGLNINASAADALFCAVTGGIGAAAFLLIRPSVSLIDRLRAIGLWDLAILATLAIYVLFIEPENAGRDIVYLIFIGIFVLGFSTGVKLLLHRRK